MTGQTNSPSEGMALRPQPIAAIATSGQTRVRSWAGVTVAISEFSGPGHDLEDLRSNQPRLTAILQQIGGRVEMRLTPYPSAEPKSQERTARHLTLTPADLPLWQASGRLHYIRRLTIDFDLATLSMRFGDVIEAASNFTPRLMFRDNGLLILVELLANACVDADADGAPYGDSLALAIAYNLFRADRRPRKRSGLAPAQLRRVTAHMKESLLGPTSLKGLAEMTGLSPSYFSRAFKISTGVAPHRWYLTERIRRAQAALLETDNTLADVALAIGFADQSHFTRAFRTIAGVTPGLWRRNHEAWARRTRPDRQSPSSISSQSQSSKGENHESS